MAYIETKKGWWVPVDHFFEQTAIPTVSVFHHFRLANGKEVRAAIIYGRHGWWDANYEPIRGRVVEWFKPAPHFRSAEDMEGDADYRARVLAEFERGRNILRSAS